MGKTKNKLKKDKNISESIREVVNLNYEDTTNCPECGEELRFEGGCNSCPNCGYSKCS
jgi:ribonucleoside-diphosphate reductase alpha chain